MLGGRGGAQFADLNNDGVNELFVANGFISADRQKNYWYAMSKIAGRQQPAVRGICRDLARIRECEPLRLRTFTRSISIAGVAGWVDCSRRMSGVTDLYDGPLGGDR